MCTCPSRAFDLAKDTTVEGVVLDKISADLALDGAKKYTHNTPTGTWTWTPRRRKTNWETVIDFGDTGINIERFQEDCNGCQ